MLDTYALGRSYGPSSISCRRNIAKNKADKAQALRELVGNTTAEDLAARAAEIKALRDEFKAKRAAEADALANPKTLQDFRGFMSHWADQGETSQAAYLRLTPSSASSLMPWRPSRRRINARRRSAGPGSRCKAPVTPRPAKSSPPNTPNMGMTCLWCSWPSAWSAMLRHPQQQRQAPGRQLQQLSRQWRGTGLSVPYP
jgi:hypothetical protein